MPTVCRRIRALFSRDRLDRELHEEMDLHLERLAARFRAEGLDETEARRQARIEFGSWHAIREEARDARGVRVIDDLFRDLRLGLRRLRKTPGFSAVAIVSLAIGIGANAAVFSLVNAVLLRDVPLDRPEELVNVYLDQGGGFFTPISYPDFEDLRDGTGGVFSEMGAATFAGVETDRDDGVVLVELVTGGLFSVLGVEAALGRTIGPEDHVAPGAHPVVMLSDSYWQSRFGGDPDAVGGELRLGGRAYTIVGVAPPAHLGFIRGLEPALYAPFMMVNELNPSTIDYVETRGFYSLWGRGRLAPSVTVAQADTAVAAVVTTLEASYPDEWANNSGFLLVPTAGVLIDPNLDPYIKVAAGLLLVVVGLVLFLACTNLAGFLLARALDRRREVAVRLALGASRGALVRQLLTESTVLSLLGGSLGLGLGAWLLGALMTSELPLPSPITFDLSLDGAVLAFTLGVSVVSATLVGLVPALQSTRPDVASTLKSDTLGGGQPGQQRWRNALVVTQLTVSLVLLVCAGLFLRSFQQIAAVDPGFGRDPTALMSIRLPASRFTAEEGQRYTRQLLDRFRALPGVEAVGLIDFPPLGLTRVGIGINVDGHDPPPGQQAFSVARKTVDEGFFDAAGIPLVRGRAFSAVDGPDGVPAAIISEAMARRFWPDGDAVGGFLRRATEGDADLVVVGVAADIKVYSRSEAPAHVVYLPYAQNGARELVVVARTSANPEQTALALPVAGREVDPNLWVVRTTTMARHLESSTGLPQLSAALLSAFGVLALMLSTVGLYGVVSYAVARRTREVGIRMALGASMPAITRLLTTGGVWLVLVGGAIGLILSLLLAQLLSSLLFGVQPFDPIAFVGAPLVLIATAALASYLPARRASHTDPVAALRAE